MRLEGLIWEGLILALDTSNGGGAALTGRLDRLDRSDLSDQSEQPSYFRVMPSPHMGTTSLASGDP